MRIFNPTPEQLLPKAEGVAYFIDPGKQMSVPDHIGEWLLSSHRQMGLVDISATVGEADSKRAVVMKALEGMDAYTAHCHKIIESFINFDTELKAINAHGSYLDHPNVRRTKANLAQVAELRRALEAQYGLSVATEEARLKTETLLSTVDALIAQNEADVAAAERTRVQEAQFETSIEEITGFYKSGFDPKSVNSPGVGAKAGYSKPAPAQPVAETVEMDLGGDSSLEMFDESSPGG